jgi:CRISPR-associated protein Csx1
MGKMVDILISVIGSPWHVYPDPDKMRWYRAEYKFSDDVECVDGKPDYVRSRTTLAALHECLKPQYVIVVAQDTILVKNPAELKDDYSYDDVIKDVENIVEEFLKRADMEVGRDGEVRRAYIYDEVGSKLSIIVAPGSGRFRNLMSVGAKQVTINLDVCGSLEDYYSYLLLSLASHMLAIVEREGPLSKLKVHLDLSHGINYMPALTYKAVTDLLPVIAAYIGGGEEGKERDVVVKLSTYNSEPVLKNEDISLIHRVEELKVREGGNFGLAPSYERPSQRKPRLLTLNRYCAENAGLNKVKELGRRIGSISGELADRLNLDGDRLSAFAGSLTNGLPLLLLETMPTTRLHDYVEQVLREYRRNVVVNFNVRSSNEVDVRMLRLARLPRDTVAVAKILLASELIKSRPKLTNIRYSDHGVSLRDLNSLTRVAFSWSTRLRLTTSHELNRIENTIEQMKDQGRLKAGEWIRYADVMYTHEPKGSYELEGGGPERSKCECNILDRDDEQRHFLQHAGLHRCIVMVKVQDGDVWLKYDFDLCKELREKVYEVACRGLVRVA